MREKYDAHRFVAHRVMSNYYRAMDRKYSIPAGPPFETLAECQAWVDRNQEMLATSKERQG
jgi:hypothetical protein